MHRQRPLTLIDSSLNKSPNERILHVKIFHMNNEKSVTLSSPPLPLRMHVNAVWSEVMQVHGRSAHHHLPVQSPLTAEDGSGRRQVADMFVIH